jgi:hypothetical protein
MNVDEMSLGKLTDKMIVLMLSIDKMSVEKLIKNLLTK